MPSRISGPTDPDPAVGERLARYHRDRDIRTLWPGITFESLTAAQIRIERVARAILAEDRSVMLDARSSNDAYALKIAAYMTGTGALLGRWIEDGRVVATPVVRNIFATELAQGRKRAERIERGVVPAFDSLLARGIRPIVLKGFHTARAYAEEPGVRPIADVDMLVPPARISEVEAALTDAGFIPTQPPRNDTGRPYKRHWRAAHVDTRRYSVEGIDARSPWELDVHASFDRDFYDMDARLDSLNQYLVDFEVAGRRLLAPAQPLLIHVLALQVSQALKSLRLMRLIDLVRVVQIDRTRGTLDWDAVLRVFADTGTARFTYPALALAEDLAPGTIDPRVLSAARKASSRLARRVVRTLRPGGASVGHTSIALPFMWARGPVSVVRVVAALFAQELASGPRQLGATLAMLARRLVSREVSIGAREGRK